MGLPVPEPSEQRDGLGLRNRTRTRTRLFPSQESDSRSSHGEPVEVRADEDGVEERGRDRAGRSEDDPADQQCGHLDAPATRRRPLQEQGMQKLVEPLGVAAGEPVALPQDRLPRLGDRGAGPLGDRLRVPLAVSSPVTPGPPASGTLSIDLDTLRPERSSSLRCESIRKLFREFPREILHRTEDASFVFSCFNAIRVVSGGEVESVFCSVRTVEDSRCTDGELITRTNDRTIRET